MIAKLNKEKLNVIAHKLGVPEGIDGYLNMTTEDVRLSFCFEKADKLECILTQVLFDSLVYDELNDKQIDELNLYKLFFTGLGNDHFYFNESFLRNDIKESITLNDYCKRDYFYQQLALIEQSSSLDIQDYQFTCDYWVRFINDKQELVYATLRSADSELYWALEEEANTFIEQYIPHNISLVEHSTTIESDLIECEILTEAYGNEIALNQLNLNSRSIINELTSHYQKSLIHDVPCVWSSDGFDDRGSRYNTYIANNRSAAERIFLRDFETSLNQLMTQAPWNVPENPDYSNILKRRLMLSSETEWLFGDENKRNLLDFTYKFAEKAHQGQLIEGRGGKPYFNHLIDVVQLLTYEVNVINVQVLVSAYLQGIFENTQVKPADIQLHFGQNVYKMVRALSDDNTPTLKHRKDEPIDCLADASDSIKLIKLAVHCSNIRSISDDWDQEFLPQYLKLSYAVASQCFHLSPTLTRIYENSFSIALKKIKAN
tara:strand:- start:1858 stop:3321 length:1464 start_codon:yes stop_codon:yes gene_type:complete